MNLIAGYQPPSPTDEELLRGSLVFVDEDGESWIIEGHHPADVAIALVWRFERLCIGDDFEEAGFDEGEVSHYYAIHDDAEDLMRICSADTPGSFAYTLVQR